MTQDFTYLAYPDPIPEALQRYISYIRFDPDNESLHVSAIECAMGSRMPIASIKSHLSAALAQFSDSSQLKALEGRIALAEGDFKHAQELYQALLLNHPNEAALIHDLAYAHMQQGQFEAAMQTLDAYKEALSDFAPAYILHARCLHNLERFDDAEAILTPLTKNEQAPMYASALLALLKQDKGDAQGAAELGKKVVDSDIAVFEGCLAYAEATASLGDVPAALEFYQQAVALSPRSGRALSGLAQAQFYEFDFANAERSVAQALSDMDTHVGTWLMAGWIALANNQTELAWERFERGYLLDKNFGDSHGCMAVRFIKTNEMEKAERHIRLGEMLDPNSYAVQYAHMLMAERAGDKQAYDARFSAIKNTPFHANGVIPQTLIDERMKVFDKRNKSS